MPEEPFPRKVPRRRRRRRVLQTSAAPLELPSRQNGFRAGQTPPEKKRVLSPNIPPESFIVSRAQSEDGPTQPADPLPVTSPSSSTHTEPASVPTIGNRKPATPAIPLTPAVPRIPVASKQATRESVSAVPSAKAADGNQGLSASSDVVSTPTLNSTGVASPVSEQTSTPASPPQKAPPKSWADLVRIKASTAQSPRVTPASNGVVHTNGFGHQNSASLGDALTSFAVDHNDAEAKISFLEPRGLVNTGNMCYMNSVLQMLVFCVPFYEFLDQVGKRAAHSFKSDTPLIDAMIMFMREYLVIDAAVSVDRLRMRLKDSELEQYGEAFIPEFVYEVIRKLPRFSTMRRGHQQDAEEFLGFLLEGLHDECGQVMRNTTLSAASGTSTPTNGLTLPNGEPAETPSPIVDGGWLEVGPKQKAAVTRSSGTIATESPITKIFGGKLRSELRVPGLKNSVTLEPYQPLQLDIGLPHVQNITDALKGLTRSENLTGDFNSPRGPGVTATKQVFIETLPPVLILHLKRFQYDNTGGTQKIWKKVGYPLELEIPKEVFPPHKRGSLLAHGGLPTYRLIGVVYHHGKNASGGHYSVDVRRQEGREWIRIDDTVIRRVRSEDVAEGGSEEDSKALESVLENHKRDNSAGGNIFERVGLDGEEAEGTEQGWSQVNGTGSGAGSAPKKWSGVAASTALKTSGTTTPKERFSVKDNKVAYLLFYQKIKV
ncbi:MAG: Ubiquitin carboxyl-terminal hydrolase 10 [Pycnora praestabilis]|nr:MAG: Ubiquitin carboxyl-terminal hydrolase 10 [Pycnora praestabilis]